MGSARLDFDLRPPFLSDVEALLDFDRFVSEDANFQGGDPDESLMNPDEKRDWIRSCASPDCFSLIAERGGVIIGFLESRVRERPRMNSHVLRFYIAVRSEFWGKGIGTVLLERMLEWALGQARIEKISLSVLSTNERAIRLYQKFGFTEDGRKKREFQLPDGTYADDLSMALFPER